MQQYDESQNDDVSERIQTCTYPHPKKKYDFLYRKFRKYKLMYIYWKWIGGG